MADAPVFQLRPIEPRDDAAVAAIIRTVMPEFGASGPGFAINDPEVDGMSAAYAAPRSRYFVVTSSDGTVVGGAGFAPLTGGAANTCELRKMYYLPAARGTGMGRKLLVRILSEAAQAGFTLCYLETLDGMVQARKLYESLGFTRIPAPLGGTGHFSCDAYYTKNL